MPERLGIGYEDIKKLNPKIIYCHISGFGYGGPMEQVPGFDPNYVALGAVQGRSATVPTASMSPPPNPSPSAICAVAACTEQWPLYCSLRPRKNR